MDDQEPSTTATEVLLEENRILMNFVTARRRARMEHVLSERTSRLHVVVEDVYQPHNASAVLRSCDAFGVQQVTIIENRNEYRVNPGVELGTSQWLTLKHYRKRDDAQSNTARCITDLRKNGWRIVATTPHENGKAPEELPLDRPLALLFGSEKDGLSDVALRAADAHVQIPMRGFVESLNISVAAALVLRSLTERIRTELADWHLCESESTAVLNSWLRTSVANSEVILRDAGRAAT